MNGRSILILTVVFICMVAIIESCKHEPIIVPNKLPNNNDGGSVPLSPPPPIYGSSGDTVKDSICFNEEILPLIQSNCAKSGCHDPITRKEGLVLNTYGNILRIITPGKPAYSKLWQMINQTGSDRMPPYPNTPLTQSQKDLIKQWILDGAKDNVDCGMSCDTTIYTYSGAVSHTIQNYCVGCHNGGSAGNYISLLSYSDVITQVNNGKLWGAINHLNGFFPMPQNGTALDDCRITTIKKWITAGAPNN
jgi:hypothetical protein